MKKLALKILKILCMLMSLLVLSLTMLTVEPDRAFADTTFDSSYSIEYQDTVGGIFEFNGHYYKYFNRSYSWENAKKYCEMLRGHLATINSQEENDYIFSKWRSDCNKSCWLGASDADSEGYWYWVTDEPFLYTNWHQNEPNGGTRQNYLQFYVTYVNGEWDDETGSKENSFLCEWESNSLLLTDGNFISCEDSNINDSLLYNGHLYQFFTTSMTWDAAQQACLKLGGHLATIGSKEEDAILFQYINLFGYNSSYLGASDAECEGQWVWVTGEPFEYTNFNFGEPNGGTSQNVLQYYNINGTWDDGNSKGNVFLCEWDDVCLVNNQLFLSHLYVNVSIQESTCISKGISVDKCTRCSYEKQTELDMANHNYQDWYIVSGNKLIPPIIKEKVCEVCGDTQRVVDWSYIWILVIVCIIAVLSIFGVINYIKVFRKK